MPLINELRRMSYSVCIKILLPLLLSLEIILADEDEDGWNAYFGRRNVDDRHLDIQKTWDALHFLLTGSTSEAVDNMPSPLQYVILGGTETEWETGYSNVRELTPQQVQEVSCMFCATFPQQTCDNGPKLNNLTPRICTLI